MVTARLMAGTRLASVAATRPELTGLNLNASGTDSIAVCSSGGFKFDVSLLVPIITDMTTIQFGRRPSRKVQTPLWLVQNSYSIDNQNAEYPRITLGNTSHGVTMDWHQLSG